MKNLFKNLLFIGSIVYFGSSTIQAQAPTIHWQKCYGDVHENVAYNVIQTSDGGFITVGTTNTTTTEGNSGFMIVKINSIGTIEWEKNYGGSNGAFAQQVVQDSDGSFVIAGFTSSNDGDVTGNHGNFDYWVIKIDSVGSILWQNTYGGSQNEEATGIIKTNDNGYIIVGYTTSNDGDVTLVRGYSDSWVIKIDTNGSIIWQQSLGGDSTDFAHSVYKTTDGGCIIAGTTESSDGALAGHHGSVDYWIAKLDINGNLQWQKPYGGTTVDRAYSVIQTNDGGYLVGGRTLSDDGDITSNQGYNDGWLVKLDEIGNIEWQKTIGGTLDDIIYSCIQNSDNSYLVTGITYSNNGDVSGNHGVNDAWIVKLNITGDILWQKAIGGSDYDEFSSSYKTTDGGYVFAGYTNSNNGDISGNHGSTDFLVVKFRADNLSTDSFSNNNTISLFPNPAKESLTVKLDFYTPSQKIIITDVLGKIIHTQKVDGLTTTIKTDGFKNGVYFVNSVDGAQKITQRFIKI